MAIEVLLMKAVDGLGNEGDVVRVAPGYARNYLFPRQFAAEVTDTARRRLARRQAERTARDADTIEQFRALANRLSQMSCTIPVKTGEAEQLYGSVGAADIAAALAAQDVTLDRHAIALEQPIKELGVFDVPVQLHPQVATTIKVWVVEE